MDSQRGASAEVSLARRRFLMAGGVGAAGVVAAVMGRGKMVVPAEAAPVAPEAEVATGGYHETEHIRKYYRCARYW